MMTMPVHSGRQGDPKGRKETSARGRQLPGFHPIFSYFVGSHEMSSESFTAEAASKCLLYLGLVLAGLVVHHRAKSI